MNLRLLRFFRGRHPSPFGMATPNIEDVRKSPPAGTDRLDSWKEIATYMGRALRTVQRWEKDHDLPIHRHTEQKNKGSVFAFQSEIDTWWDRNRDQLAGEGQAAEAIRPEIGTKRVHESVRWWLIAATAVLLVAVAVASWNGRSGPSTRILTDSQPSLRRVVKLDSPLFSTSPDGRWVAYPDNSTREIRLEDLEGRVPSRPIGERWRGGRIIWSRDSGQLAAITNPPAQRPGSAIQIEIFDVTTGSGEVVWRGDVRTEVLIPSDWTPDRQHLICLRGDQPSMYDQWGVDDQVEILALSLADGSLTSIAKGSAVHLRPKVSPNARFVAYSACPEGQCDIYLSTLDGSRKIRLTEHDAGDELPVWSLDGRMVLFSSNRRHREKGEIWAVAVDPSSGTRVGKSFYVAETGTPNWEPSLTQRGDLLFGRRPREGQVFVLPVNPATGLAEDKPESPFSDGTHRPIWRGGSKLAVVRRGRRGIEVVERDLELGGERVVTLAERWSGGSITPPPDGRPFAARGFLEDRKQAIFAFRPPNDSVTHLYTLEGGLQPSPMSWSPDGTKLLFTEIVRSGGKKYSMNVKVIDRTGAEALLVAKTLRPPYPIWSPDGSQIAFSDGDCIFVVPSDPGTEAGSSSQTRRTVTCASLFETTSFKAGNQVLAAGHLAWSPDGSKLAWTVNYQEERRIQLRIVDYATGTQTVSWSGEPDYESWPVEPQWSPKGDRISFEMNYKRQFEIWALSGFLPDALSGG